MIKEKYLNLIICRRKAQREILFCVSVVALKVRHDNCNKNKCGLGLPAAKSIGDNDRDGSVKTF